MDPRVLREFAMPSIMFERRPGLCKNCRNARRINVTSALCARCSPTNEFAAPRSSARRWPPTWTPTKSVTERPGCGTFSRNRNPASAADRFIQAPRVSIAAPARIPQSTC